MQTWRDARRGKADFAVEALVTDPTRAGPFGIVRVKLNSKTKSNTEIQRQDSAVQATIRHLQELQLLPVMSEDIYFIPDTVVFANSAAYIIKPQTQRAWLMRQALRDKGRDFPDRRAC